MKTVALERKENSGKDLNLPPCGGTVFVIRVLPPSYRPEVDAMRPSVTHVARLLKDASGVPRPPADRPPPGTLDRILLREFVDAAGPGCIRRHPATAFPCSPAATDRFIGSRIFASLAVPFFFAAATPVAVYGQCDPPPVTVTLLSPVGGEVFSVQDTITIVWETSGPLGSYFDGNFNPCKYARIDVSYNGGASWTLIAQAQYGVYAVNWQIPLCTLSGQIMIRVRVRDSCCPCIGAGCEHISVSGPITVIPPEENAFFLTSPIGDKAFAAGVPITIAWESMLSPQAPANYCLYACVNGAQACIEYSQNNGNSWAFITCGPASGGAINWMPPSCVNWPQTLVRVRATDACNRETIATSGVFSIVTPAPEIAILNPTQNTLWPAGSVQTISWSTNMTTITLASGCCYAGFPWSIEASYDNGQTWQYITNCVSCPAVNSHMFSWTLPTCVNYSQCKIRVKARHGCSPYPEVVGMSNTFSVVSAVVTVNSPNGGESLLPGNAHTISWDTSAGPVNSNVAIDYSITGVTWLPITGSTPNDGSYDWVVPNAPTTQGKVRVTAYPTCGGSVSDTSDGVFIILPNCDDGDPCTADLPDPQSLGCVHWPLDCAECDTDGDCFEVPGFTTHCIDGACYYAPIVCLNVRPCEYRYINPITGECDTINLCEPGLCCTDVGCLPCDLNGDGVLDGLDIAPLVEAIMNGAIPPTALQGYYVPALLGLPLP